MAAMIFTCLNFQKPYYRTYEQKKVNFVVEALRYISVYFKVAVMEKHNGVCARFYRRHLTADVWLYMEGDDQWA